MREHDGTQGFASAPYTAGQLNALVKIVRRDCGPDAVERVLDGARIPDMLNPSMDIFQHSGTPWVLRIDNLSKNLKIGHFVVADWFQRNVAAFDRARKPARVNVDIGDINSTFDKFFGDVTEPATDGYCMEARLLARDVRVGDLMNVFGGDQRRFVSFLSGIYSIMDEKRSRLPYRNVFFVATRHNGLALVEIEWKKFGWGEGFFIHAYPVDVDNMLLANTRVWKPQDVVTNGAYQAIIRPPQ